MQTNTLKRMTAVAVLSLPAAANAHSPEIHDPEPRVSEESTLSITPEQLVPDAFGVLSLPSPLVELIDSVLEGEHVAFCTVEANTNCGCTCTPK